MAENTKIEWADATVNHWAGCTKVSPACDNCYAERMAGRLWKVQWGAGEIVRRAIGSAELLQSRYKISAGECRISALGGPVLRYLVDLSRLRMAYSALG